MNGRRIRKSLLSITVGLLGLGLFAAYPTLERARELFPSGQLLSMDVDMRSLEYSEFVADLRLGGEQDQMQLLENYLVTSITSSVVVVSTNAIDTGVNRWRLNNRGIALANMAGSLTLFKTNAVQCEAVAGYVGTVRRVDYPSDLVGQRMSYFHWNQGSADSTNTMSQIQSIEDARRIQSRVFDANRGIMEYRKHLCAMCGHAVHGCQNSMSPSDFTAFTNRLVTVSGANEEERKELFWALEELTDYGGAPNQ